MVTVYRHDDSSAPVLRGEVGSLIDLLDACLVNGYGVQPAAGWTKAFSGTNKAIYANDDAGGGSGCHVRVDDNAPDDDGNGDGANAATVRVGATASDIDTLDYPTDLTWLRKSDTNDATARPWILIADGRTWWFYLIDDGGNDSVHRNRHFSGAGDFEAFAGIGAFNYFSLGRQTGLQSGDSLWASLAQSTTPVGGLKLVHADGITGPIDAVRLRVDGSSTTSTSRGNTDAELPDPDLTGNIRFYSIRIGNQGTEPYGYLRGVKVPDCRLEGIYNHGEEVESSGLIYTAVNVGGNLAGAAMGAFLVDSGGPW